MSIVEIEPLFLEPSLTKRRLRRRRFHGRWRGHVVVRFENGEKVLRRCKAHRLRYAYYRHIGRAQQLAGAVKTVLGDVLLERRIVIALENIAKVIDRYALIFRNVRGGEIYIKKIILHKFFYPVYHVYLLSAVEYIHRVSILFRQEETQGIYVVKPCVSVVREAMISSRENPHAPCS